MPEPDFARVFDEAPAPFLLLLPDFTIVRANRARLEATATTLEESVGKNLFDRFPTNPRDPDADGPANMRASLEQVLRTRRAHTMPIQKYDIPMPDGTFVERYWSPRNVPILDDTGEVAFILHRSDDITDYIRDRDDARLEAAQGAHLRERVEQVESDLYARTRELESTAAELREVNERERRTARRLAGLVRAASSFAAAEDLDDLLAEVSTSARRLLGADAAVVALVRPEGLRLMSVSGTVLPGMAAATGAGTITATGSGALDGVAVPPPLVAAASDGPVLVPDAVREGAELSSPEGAAVVPEPLGPGVRAWAALPLLAGRRRKGAVAVGWREPQRLEESDVRLLEAFVAECAQAVSRVRRLEEERVRAAATRTFAETLQRSMLTEPPEHPGSEIAVRYRPAAQEVQVGGDWYDAFRAPDGAITLAIGDITGHDQAATAVMGQVRNVLRGIAQAVSDPPAKILSLLDRAMENLGMSTLATSVLARVEEGPDGSRSLRWSNAGHPPPLVIEPDGTVHVLERPADLLLGVVPDASRSDHVVPLVPGATVILYTDGLVERRGEALDTGLARLATVAGRLSDLPLERLCDVLVRRIAPDPDDDMAMVALRLDGSGVDEHAVRPPARRAAVTEAPSEWWSAVGRDLPPDPTASRQARQFLAAAISAGGGAFVDVATVQLLTSELVTNAVRHGGGRVRVRVLTAPRRVRVEVHDAGTSVPSVKELDLESENGRGMWLVDAMADEWGVVEHGGTHGKDVWFEIS